LCHEPSQTILSCFFCIKSQFGASRIFPQAILSGDNSSHDHPFILIFFPCRTLIYVSLPYCDEPIIIIIKTPTYSCTENIHGAWGPHSESLNSFSLIAQSFFHHPSDRSRLRIPLSTCHAKRVSYFIYHACRTNTRCTMETSQDIRKRARSGRVVRLKPQDLVLINEDPNSRASFQHVECMHYCDKIHGYNVKLTEQFALRFNGFHAVIVVITFQVTEETLSVMTDIHL
jgi:hypothetical protein